MTLQSLDIARKRSAEGLDTRQAEANASAIVAASEALERSFATRRDLKDLEWELKRHVDGSIAGLRTELKQEIDGLHTEQKQDSTGLKRDISELRTEMQLLIERSQNKRILSIAGTAALVFAADKRVN